MLEPRKTSSLALALLAATCLTPPDSARAEPGGPLGGEIQVNSYTDQSQVRSAVAADAEGNFVVVWKSFLQDGTEGSIYAQRFDAAGAPDGEEFPIDFLLPPGIQDFPAVAMHADGSFVVVWDGEGWMIGSPSPVLADDQGVFAHRFSAAGEPPSLRSLGLGGSLASGSF